MAPITDPGRGAKIVAAMLSAWPLPSSAQPPTLPHVPVPSRVLKCPVRPLELNGLRIF